MSSDESKKEPVAIARVHPVHFTDWTPERIEIVKRSICPRGISVDEFTLFIEQCKRSGLDPLLKEAFCVARRMNIGNRDKPEWVTKHEFQPSEAGMLARAERFPDYDGLQASAVYGEDEITIDQGKGEVVHRFNPAQRKGALVGAWARLVRKGKLPVVVWLELSGYIQQTPLWSKIPATMIEKCARVAALRKAYPEAFGGMYVREEQREDEESEEQVRSPIGATAPVLRRAPANEPPAVTEPAPSFAAQAAEIIEKAKALGPGDEMGLKALGELGRQIPQGTQERKQVASFLKETGARIKAPAVTPSPPEQVMEAEAIAADLAGLSHGDIDGLTALEARAAKIPAGSTAAQIVQDALAKAKTYFQTELS